MTAPSPVCLAEEFRARHHGFRLTLVGYSAAPLAVEEAYQKLVKVHVTRHGPYEHEEQRCLCCGEIVFEADHS